MHRRAQRCHLADQTLLSQRSGVPGGRFILTRANTYHTDGIAGRGEERVENRFTKSRVVLLVFMACPPLRVKRKFLIFMEEVPL